MTMKFLHPMVVLAAVPLLTSCATIFWGKNTEITLCGPTDEAVELQVGPRTYKNQQLPATIELKRTELGQAITATSEHYRFSPLIPGYKINPWAVAQVLSPFGVVGIVVDAVTGCVEMPTQKTYAFHYASKADTLTQLPPVSGDYKLPEPKRQPSPFRRHHQLSLGVGIGNTDDQLYENLTEQLTEDYKMERAAIMGSPYVAVNAAYHYNFNRHWAVGIAAGFNHLNNLWNNNDVRNRHLFRWRTYAYFNEMMGNEGAARYYRSLDYPKYEGSLTHNTYSLLPSVKYIWTRNPSAIYSGIALGVAYQTLRFHGEKAGEPWRIHREKWSMGMQFTMIGLDWGRGPLHGFIELGAGHQGILSAGLSYHL